MHGHDCQKKTKPKVVPDDEWKAGIKCLVNSLVHEPTHNGHIGNDISEELEKYNEGCKIHKETKTIDGPTTEPCHGLGTDTNDYHELIPLVEGSFMCSACKRTCCKHCSLNTNFTYKESGQAPVTK